MKYKTSKEALENAKKGQPGSEHRTTNLIVYVRTQNAVVRLVKSDEGRTVSERVVWTTLAAK